MHESMEGGSPKGGAPNGGPGNKPLYDVIMVDDPLTMAREAKARMEAIDPTMDRINRRANAVVGMGRDINNDLVWFGRRCCFFIFERLHELSREKSVPFSMTCPACQRTWRIRVAPGVYRVQNA